MNNPAAVDLKRWMFHCQLIWGYMRMDQDSRPISLQHFGILIIHYIKHIITVTLRSDKSWRDAEPIAEALRQFLLREISVETLGGLGRVSSSGINKVGLGMGWYG